LSLSVPITGWKSIIGLGAPCLILVCGLAAIDLERAKNYQEAVSAANRYSVNSLWHPNKSAPAVNKADPKGFPKAHPVLRVVARDADNEETEEEKLTNHPLLKTRLEDATFKRMLALTIPDNWTKRWADAYGQAEVEAAQQIAARLKGLSKAEVAKLLGPPICNGSSPFCCVSPTREKYCHYRLHLKSGEVDGRSSGDDLRKTDTWLYFFGGRRLAIRPMFVGGICKAVHFCAYENDQTYLKWRIDRLTDCAVGMTKAQILAQEGPGLSGASLKSLDRINSNSEDCEETQQNDLDKIRQATDVLEYQLGYRGTVILGFSKGICIGVCRLRSFWCTVGSGQRTWDHSDIDPVFRMP
jgi:hypothetical protein